MHKDEQGHEVLRPEQARQGSWGSQVLMVLVGGLALAAVVWWGVEIYGENIDNTPTAATQPGAPTAPPPPTAN